MRSTSDKVRTADGGGGDVDDFTRCCTRFSSDSLARSADTQVTA
eukprot:CAMPEP_0171643328 /NCGR_PEP_ID=MMETSP0990-20121206/32596_1 /TAXON_ID=483369 /ORGANISM="non described non described, Strain CCMP2098" /LENGTH=43 /DNA_ID= /DNA_START= /DNA_END= /DNA_ORIENTATION=